jgi:hypothetical protein
MIGWARGLGHGQNSNAKLEKSTEELFDSRKFEVGRSVGIAEKRAALVTTAEERIRD